MKSYVCNSEEVINGTNFLNSFLDSIESKKYDLIIYENLTERDVFFSDFTHISFQYFYNLNKKLKNKEINLIFILSAVQQEYYKIYNHSNIKIIYAPFYFINYLINENCTIHTWNEFYIDYKKNLNQNNFNTFILNLNNRPHYHRCLMMDYSCKSGLIDNMTYTWQENKSEYDYYTFKWWNPTINSININDDNLNCLDVLHNKPAFHLVTESEINYISFSEKVFKSILSGIPFLVFGGVGYHKKLKEYGFELYDEIFDYSFDNVKCDSTRANLICNNFLKHKNSNYKDLINLVYHKVEKNREIALDIFYNKKFIPKELYEIFETHIKRFKDIELEAYQKLNVYLS